MSIIVETIEALRAELHANINSACDNAIGMLGPQPTSAGVRFKSPTPSDGLDQRNKTGQFLTPRGMEILYRVFDEGGGYNRAARMLSISQGAAKNRKDLWVKLGGLTRTKQILDIDTI